MIKVHYTSCPHIKKHPFLPHKVWTFFSSLPSSSTKHNLSGTPQSVLWIKDLRKGECKEFCSVLRRSSIGSVRGGSELKRLGGWNEEKLIFMRKYNSRNFFFYTYLTIFLAPVLRITSIIRCFSYSENTTAGVRPLNTDEIDWNFWFSVFMTEGNFSGVEAEK